MSPRIHRRQVLASGALIAVLPQTLKAAPARGPGLAITIDDFDLSDTALMSGEARDLAIRKALGRHGVKAAGFVAGKFVDADRSPRVLTAWSREGHVLGNHSFSHAHYGGADPAGEIADVLRCEALLTPYAGFRRLFRYPFLAEGKTAAGRDEFRALLHDHGYRIAPVTIDTSDWYVDERLRARLQTDPRADISGYRRYWLDHLWDRANYYDGLAREVLGHSLDHTILLHHRLATGLFLDDALSMFRSRGWRLVDASAAFEQPDLKREYPTLPSGQSLVWAAAKASGRFDDRLRYPGEDDSYEKPKLDALSL
jgi:peptidoglycan/xylan/chitin deacetylase (PgdA/CDA1 family)